MRTNELTDVEKESIKQYAACDMVMADTARRMFFNRNTIEYRFSAVRRKTGLNPKNFFDLVKLMRMIGEDV